jgi:RNA polymerase sigma factor (sigma-70 family)
MPGFPNVISNDDEMIRNLKESVMVKRKAEEQLFTSHSYFIREAINKFSLDQEEAFNAYSDAVLQAIQNITTDKFEKRSSLKTYLYKIFNNKCVDLIRKKTTNKSSVHQTVSIPDMLTMISDPAKTVIQKLIEKNDTELLKLRLNEIGENCKQLLSLYADGYTDKEIAASMNYKSDDVVKTSRLRCIEKLRKLYKTTHTQNG